MPVDEYNNKSIRLEVRYSCGRDSDLIRRETGTLRDPTQRKTCIGVLGPNVSVRTRACNTWSYLPEQKSSPLARYQCFPNNAKFQKMSTSKYAFKMRLERVRKIRMFLGRLGDWELLSDVQETPTSGRLRPRLSISIASFRYSRCPGPLLVRRDSPRSQQSLKLPSV